MEHEDISWRLATSNNMWVVGVQGPQGPQGAQGVQGAVGPVGVSGPSGTWTSSGNWGGPTTTILVDGEAHSFTDSEVRAALTEIKQIELLAEEFPQVNHALKHLRAMVKLHKAE